MNPLVWLGKGAVGKIFSSVSKAISSVQDTRQAQVTSKADVLIADAKGDSWMQRTWRPFLGYTLTLIVFVELIIVRIINIVLDLKRSDIDIDYRNIPAEVWTTIILVAGVFGGGREISKFFKGRKLDAKIAQQGSKKTKKRKK